MRLGLIAKKIGMSRFYDSSGVNHPVTILKVDESTVADLRTVDKNGYSAVRLSFGNTKKTLNKPTKGFLKKQKITSFIVSKEFRVNDSENYNVGDRVGVNNFIEGQFVDVTSNSKGKGFAGGMKRHNFGGNRATHGVSISHRSHGSTGQCQDPGKVFKGKKMAGRLGNVKVTIQNLKIIKIDSKNNLILVKGAVPGHKNSVLKVFDSVKKNQNIKLEDNNKTTDLESKKQVDNETPQQNQSNTETIIPSSNSSNEKNNEQNLEVQNNETVSETNKDTKDEVEPKTNEDNKWNRKLKI